MNSQTVNAQPSTAPFFHILTGNPDDSQVAALTVVFAALAQVASSAPQAAENLENWRNLADNLSSPFNSNPNSLKNVNFV